MSVCLSIHPFHWAKPLVHVNRPLQTRLAFLAPPADLVKPSGEGSWPRVVFFPVPISFPASSPTRLSPCRLDEQFSNFSVSAKLPGQLIKSQNAELHLQSLQFRRTGVGPKNLHSEQVPRGHRMTRIPSGATL